MGKYNGGTKTICSQDCLCQALNSTTDRENVYEITNLISCSSVSKSLPEGSLHFGAMWAIYVGQNLKCLEYTSARNTFDYQGGIELLSLRCAMLFESTFRDVAPRLRMHPRNRKICKNRLMYLGYAL